ncbi:biotin--[acetyl-CoA-carboxylase] ligase [Orenia marismortui]|uniref:biotin--[acetyl-CoA-carboxylase] ligase n=1 Tax=Orenia marismortui TaxID=46469 RepID=UPI0003800A9E|nr:biotin--[acetyl-CoA-carboxylase] ligase [Orenia marismortui]
MRKNLGRREKVLDLLYQAEGNYLSGEELSNKLGVSRTTIWKYIKYLREAGYHIDSSSKIGYRLITPADNLLPEEIKRNLNTDVIGQKIIYYKEIESTNDAAKKLAQSGLKEGTIVVSEEQKKGKGRLGKEFCSPLGGIWISCILRPDIKPTLATRATYIASLAIVKTINKLSDVDAKIKWPNDILVGDKKVSGILTEMGAELDRVDYLVVGMGINLNFPLDSFDKSLHNKVTTIYHETSKKISRVKFVQVLLEEIEVIYQKLNDFEDILEEWKEYSYTIGKQVQVESSKEKVSGTAIDIASDGALIVKVGNEIRKFYSGEVSLGHSNFSSGN